MIEAEMKALEVSRPVRDDTRNQLLGRNPLGLAP